MDHRRPAPHAHSRAHNEPATARPPAEYSNAAAKSDYPRPGCVMSMRSEGTVYYLLRNRLHSTARIVNPKGSIQVSICDYPFGGKLGGSYPVVNTKPPGPGNPAVVISPRFAPLPPAAGMLVLVRCQKGTTWVIWVILVLWEIAPLNWPTLSRPKPSVQSSWLAGCVRGGWHTDY